MPKTELNMRRRIKTYIPDFLLTFYKKRKDLYRFKHHLKPSDIFLVGHPKSGNTWLAYMLAYIIFGNRQHRVTLANIGLYVPVIHGKDSSIANYPNLSIPRIFRNEVTLYPWLYPKTVYLIRDPRGVLVSYFHMYRTIFDDNNIDLRSFLEEYLSQGCIKRWEILPRWDKQVLTWLKRSAQNKHVMIVKYEDMVRNRKDMLERVVEFTKISCTEDDLDLAVAQGSFEAMRKDEESQGAESYPGEIRWRGRFIRRGKIDGWKDEMDRSLADRIEEEFGPVMGLTGYL